MKPRPSACSMPGPGPQGPPSARHHHRLFRTLPQLNQPWHTHTHLPPIRDRETAGPSPPTSASSSLHLSPLARRAPPPFSSSCYMLEEEEPWETGPPLARIRPPPKVSRLDVGSSRLMRDCVYPKLPPLSTRTPHPPEAGPEGARSVAQESPGLGFLEESVALVEPLQPGALFGALLPEPLSLDVSSKARGGAGLHSLGLPSSPPLLSTWAMGPSDTRTPLSSSVHIGPSVPLPSAASPAVPLERPLPQPFEFTGSPSVSSSSTNNPQAQHTALMEPSCQSPPQPSYSVAPRPLRLRGIKVDAQGKRPEIISKKEARGIIKLANYACKEPLGTLGNSQLLSVEASRASVGRGEATDQSPGDRRPSGFPPNDRRVSLGSQPPAIVTGMPSEDDLLRQMSPMHRAVMHMASTGLGSEDGASTTVRRLGTPTYHLPPVKTPIGSKKKSSKHCFLCGKKTGLASSYDCRCGKNFCATHRYAEAHTCSYDYKGAGRRLLQDTHPIISAPKLPKI